MRGLPPFFPFAAEEARLAADVEALPKDPSAFAVSLAIAFLAIFLMATPSIPLRL